MRIKKLFVFLRWDKPTSSSDTWRREINRDENLSCGITVESRKWENFNSNGLRYLWKQKTGGLQTNGLRNILNGIAGLDRKEKNYSGIELCKTWFFAGAFVNERGQSSLEYTHEETGILQG